MKLTIDRVTLVKHLQKVIGPAGNKTNFPILSHVLLEANDKQVNFTTTDLDTIITANCLETFKVEKEDRIVIPIKRFLSVIKELSYDEVSIEHKEGNLSIKCGKSKIKLRTAKLDDFPEIKREKKKDLIKIEPSILSEMINLTSFCVGDNDTNYVLSGILFELSGNKITLVSTDGKRLACVKKNLPDKINTEKESFILPLKAVNELQKILKEETEINISKSNNMIIFSSDSLEFSARTIEGEFPDYKQYLPKESEGKRLNINAKDFLSGLRRANILSTSDYMAIKLSLNEKSITISKINAEIGEIDDTIQAYYKGEKLDVGFNPLYLIDVLGKLDDEYVNIDFYSSDKPAVLRKNDYEYLVLPMNV